MQKKDASNSIYIEGGDYAHIDKLIIKNGHLVEYKGSKPLTIENLTNRIELVPIRDGANWYNPPKSYKQIKLVWPARIDVAILGLEYYRSYIQQVEDKFFTNV